MGSRKSPTLKFSKIKVGLTIGDPAGIGPCIIKKAIRSIGDLAQFWIIGDKWVFEKSRAGVCNLANIKFIHLDNVRHQGFKFGKISAEYGRASVEYLDKAIELIKKKDIDCLVTGPVSKEAINLAGFKFSGQTEYLARHTKAKDVEMMLLNQNLRFVLATRHIPIKEVAQALDKTKLAKTITLAHRALKDLFLIKNPRIVVCGLNPHASDNGIIGKEENKIIKPLIKGLGKKIKYLSGPLPADVAVSKAMAKAYDCVIAIYHDQALIPLKLLGNATGVNLTLGLPFVRTSPLHGTAFDIAATNLADPASLVAAIKLSVLCTSNLKKA